MDQDAPAAILEAARLVKRFGVDATGEALLLAFESEVSGDADAADFWLTVQEEAMGILIVTRDGRSV